MNEYTELKPFLAQILRLVGNGYKYISLSRINPAKMHKKGKIKDKLSDKYNLSLTVWQRQYKRRKGIANYKGIIYGNLILILKTEGKTSIQDNSFKHFNKLPIRISDYLEIYLNIDERSKLTFMASKKFIKTFNAKIDLALKNKQGREFHHELKKLYNLHRAMPYRGFMLQVKNILELTKEKQKKYGTKYQVPKFF